MVGLDQILNKTPAVIKHIRATIIYTIAGSLAFTGTLSTKFGMTPLEYAEWCGIIILIVKAISMLFGVSDEKEVQQAIKLLDEKAPEALNSDIGGGPVGTTKPPVNP